MCMQSFALRRAYGCLEGDAEIAGLDTNGRSAKGGHCRTEH